MEIKVHDYSRLPAQSLLGGIRGGGYDLLAQDLAGLKPGQSRFVVSTNLVNAEEIMQHSASDVLAALGEHRSQYLLFAEQEVAPRGFWTLKVGRKA